LDKDRIDNLHSHIETIDIMRSLLPFLRSDNFSLSHATVYYYVSDLIKMGNGLLDDEDIDRINSSLQELDSDGRLGEFKYHMAKIKALYVRWFYGGLT
jgi:hypothetical protein